MVFALQRLFFYAATCKGNSGLAFLGAKLVRV